MNSPIKLVLSVVITCVVAASGLAVTYGFTAPRIEEQNRLAEERSLQAVAPEADDFVAITEGAALEAATAAADPVTVDGIFRAMTSGTQTGWAVKVASRGYGGPMLLVIGLDTSGSVTGVSVLRQNETPGLGTKVLTEQWFMEQFGGLPAGYTDADVRALDVISGSTRSSKGISNGVAAAGRIHADVLDGMEGGAQ